MCDDNTTSVVDLPKEIRKVIRSVQVEGMEAVIKGSSEEERECFYQMMMEIMLNSNDRDTIDIELFFIEWTNMIKELSFVEAMTL